MVHVVLVGIKGYGKKHLQELLHRVAQGKVQIAGVVDPIEPEGKTLHLLQSNEISHFSSLASFYSEKKADLAIISTPIQFHCELTCEALKNGSHVLCEKPTAATIEEVLKMMEVRNQAKRKVGIGYQWSYSQAMQALKKDIIAGKFGKPIRLKSTVLWSRNEDYYARGWAGRVKDNSGRWVLDSVAANAATHFLQNMFFVLGQTLNSSAFPHTLTAESYKANDIENFDTSFIRAYTKNKTEILFMASHAIEKDDNYGPAFQYEFEKGTIYYDENRRNEEVGFDEECITAIFHDGSKEFYGSIKENDYNKFDAIVEAIKNNTSVICGLETASSQTLALYGVHQSVPQPITFPENKIQFDEKDRVVWVEGLSKVLMECYDRWKLPSELGVEWAIKGKEIDLSKTEFYDIISTINK
ncbi:Gfo/Idh/MocA family oxidoreductase [Evansella sp. AB-P1]|uniref:Gfo/Idh/MocA family protein n=1 Tax=Evansella sp. AB-P1 TaxID=3037653 RepID=UPI0024202FB2|nr:Gfo/Idh/MocA family oxidoreductase [Evansella sp. AB-P1]MDG5786878.1 Gfo/Idh/MocA family oxidoreductase [Evansella sp. AB-P1]